MKKNTKVASKMNHKLNQMNNKVRDMVQNQLVLNVIRVLLIVYCAFIVPLLKEKTLNAINHQVVRLVLVALIVYASFIDMVVAILLTIALVLTIQRANHQGNNRNNGNNKVNNIDELSNVNNNSFNNKVNEIINNLGRQQDNFENHAGVQNNKNNNGTPMNQLIPENNVTENQEVKEVVGNENQGLQGNNIGNMVKAANGKTINNSSNILSNGVPKANDNTPHNNLQEFDAKNNKPKNTLNLNQVNHNNNKVIDMVNQEQPASETLTDNIMRSKNNHNDPTGLTTGEDLYRIQENMVPGSDLLQGVKTFKNQHSAQNLDVPMGVGGKRYDGFHFDQDNHPNLKHQMERNEHIN
jgi:hypothetical protein